MAPKKIPLAQDPCEITLALDVIGGKWKGSIIYLLKDQPRRFNELRKLMPDITQRTLTNQLRELERDGLILRTPYAETPPRVDYSVTKLCLSLIPLLDEIRDWSVKNQKQIEDARNKHSK